MVKSQAAPPPSQSVAVFVPPPFAGPPLLDVFDLTTRCDRPPLFASPSLTSVALTIPAWQDKTVQTATNAVKVLEVYLIAPTHLFVLFWLAHRTTESGGFNASDPLY